MRSREHEARQTGGSFSPAPTGGQTCIPASLRIRVILAAILLPIPLTFGFNPNRGDASAEIPGLVATEESSASTSSAPVPEDQAQQRFPQARGTNLEGREFNVPEDFEGRRNVLLIAFERWQQQEVDTWLPSLRRITDEDSTVRAYELPTIRPLPGIIRGFINRGMASGIEDQRARETTITLYLDKGPFRQAIGIETERTITVAVVDTAGAIFWKTLGIWTPEKEAILRKVLGR